VVILIGGALSELALQFHRVLLALLMAQISYNSLSFACQFEFWTLTGVGVRQTANGSFVGIVVSCFDVLSYQRVHPE
jgi:hypothetical protein